MAREAWPRWSAEQFPWWLEPRAQAEDEARCRAADESRAARHSAQMPSTSTVCDTSTNAYFLATRTAHRSTSGPSISTARHHISSSYPLPYPK